MKWRIGGRGQDGPQPSVKVASAFESATGAADGDRYAFSPNVVMLEAKPGRSSMAVRSAASELVTSHIKLGRRSVAVCGAWSGVGVSFVAVNLAVALAERGVSTVLIDANLERPSLETYIEPSRQGPGVQDFLRDEDLAITDIAHGEVLPGLSLIYSGGACQDSRELLGHTRLTDLVRGCMRNYSFTILDTPPASRSASARRIASVAGYALVVARAGASHADGIRTLSRTLAEDGVDVVGAVLNGV
jgi:protein-tyrosine kinase